MGFMDEKEVGEVLRGIKGFVGEGRAFVVDYRT